VRYELNFYTYVSQSGTIGKIFFFNVVVLAVLRIVHYGTCGPLGVL
jgi:hypothetical protein